MTVTGFEGIGRRLGDDGLRLKVVCRRFNGKSGRPERENEERHEEDAFEVNILKIAVRHVLSRPPDIENHCSATTDPHRGSTFPIRTNRCLEKGDVLVAIYGIR